MKRTLLPLCMAILMAILIPFSTLAAPAVEMSKQNLTVNGTAINCEKYNIDGANYFKLRDMAYLLRNTESQFDVGYDTKSNTVTITRGKTYTAIGTELVIGKDQSATATASRQTIQINGKAVSNLSVFNIGGNNYFKLRDLGDALGFSVDYNAKTNTALVTSSTAQQAIIETGSYDSRDEVAEYIHLYGHLPQNYIKKEAAQALGWSGGSLEPYAPGKCIGGDYFGNYEGLLPKAAGRSWTECDIDTMGANDRGKKRIVFSNDGLIYYTDNHYQSFTQLYGEGSH